MRLLSPCLVFGRIKCLILTHINGASTYPGCASTCPAYGAGCRGVDPDTKVGGDGIHVNPERSFGGTDGEPPSEASQRRKGGPGVPPLKISKTYMANGAICVIPELYL